MESTKLQIKDFKEFDTYFKKIKDEIYEKFADEPAGGISEDIAKGFQNCIEFLEQKLTKAGK
jgi:hypothetical protein